MQSLIQSFRRHPSRSSILWLVGGLLLVLLGTLAPFNFTPLAIGKKDAIKTFFQPRSDWFDFYGNIVLFFPYGLGLGGLIQTRKLPIGVKIGFLVLLSFGLTLVVEVLQLWLPSRASSATDLLTNTVGGILSGLYVLCNWRPYAHQLGRKLQLWWSKTWVVAGLLLAWLVLMNGVTLKLQSMTDLTEWNPEFRLTIGNEVTGNLFWDGQVSGLSLRSQALEEGEILPLLQSPQFPTLPGTQLDYDLTGSPPHADRSGLNAPPLIRQTEPIDLSSQPDRPIQWLSQEEPARDVINAIRQSHAFTLATTIVPNDLEQYGPDGSVPILTFSWDQYQRNLGLLQIGDRLIVAVRVPVTGYNGDHFILMRSEPLEKRASRIVVTYREGRIRLYSDRNTDRSDSPLNSNQPILDELILKPEFTFFQYVLPDNGHNFGLSEVNHRKFQSQLYPLVFYAIWSLPLGILMLRVFTLVLTRARHSRVTQIWLMLVAALPTLLFSLVLTTSISEFSPTKWLICWCFSLFPMIWSFWKFDRILRPLWPLKF
jgi:VanZ family protein